MCCCVQVLRHQHYHAGVAGPLTEASAFLVALQQLPLLNNTVIWGKSDELMEQVAKVGCRVTNMLCIFMYLKSQQLQCLTGGFGMTVPPCQHHPFEP
jgi:hypothetical protein